MTLWWLQPGWKQACCSKCGANIWNSGGDPDWGLCSTCMGEVHDGNFATPRCDICKTGEACASVGNIGVCSQECADKAAELTGAVEPKEDDHG